MTSQRPFVEAVGISVAFGEGRSRRAVVNDVSFRIRRGGAYGLIGESGCGKSTVLRALAGLNQNYEGSFLLDDAEVVPGRGKAFFRRVQMVFQDPYASLHPRKLVQNVLAEPLKVHGFDRVHARVGEALDAVGLGPQFRYRYPHELSGGQRQRVAIARALVIEPDVLLLDEPTSALDVSVQAEVLNLLKTLKKERNLTYLMVSHDLAVIAHICERAGIMHDGRILEDMTADDMRARRARYAYTRDFLEASTHDANTGNASTRMTGRHAE